MNFRVEIDPSVLVNALKEQLADVLNPKSTLYRQVAIELTPLVHQRIHVDGKAADGKQIGQYTNAYLAIRTGNFGNSAKFKKGKNKGNNKDAGSFTKGEGKGSSRPKYNRTGDRKVILSLTRQLENDYAVIAIEDGWGIGFHNAFNALKARANQERYNRPIYDLSADEVRYAERRTTELIQERIG